MKDTILRGKILEFLKKLYPEGADDRTVVGVFFEYHKVESIFQCLEYLSDKGYVSRITVPHPYKKLDVISVYKIAPAGIDLLEGTSSDPAVLIVPGED